MKYSWPALLIIILAAASSCSSSYGNEGGKVNPQQAAVASPSLGSKSNSALASSNQPPPDFVSPATPKDLKPISSELKPVASPLYFINERVGWALTKESLYTTENGGKTWTKLASVGLQNFKALEFVSEQQGLAIRDDWNSKKRSNTVLRTQDGGRSWREVLAVPTPIYTIDFIDHRVGYVSGRWYPIHQTNDGGDTWRKTNGIEGLNYLYFLDKNEGWGFGGAIWHTNDGGKTWNQVVPYEQVSDLFSVRFIDKSTAWILGGQELWFTADGATWHKYTKLPATEGPFAAIDFVSNQEGWIVSDSGSIIHTQDGGSAWETIAHSQIRFSCIRFNSPTRGWALDKNGELFQTVNGGSKWEAVSLRR
jgi:photosystem II stability/assembly factor-like uncharacterized protein